jgi:hypothetical protein
MQPPLSVTKFQTDRMEIEMATATKKTTRTVSVDLERPSEKKSVTRFDVSPELENPAMTSAYITKDALKAIGGAPNGVRITIEAL